MQGCGGMCTARPEQRNHKARHHAGDETREHRAPKTHARLPWTSGYDDVRHVAS